MMNRGFRNNNPFNLRRTGIEWRGKVSFLDSTDKEFEQFENMSYGIRAGLINLATQCRRYKGDIKEIISHYAPESDGNCTSLYIKRVVSAVGKSRIENHGDFFRMACEICRIESFYYLLPDCVGFDINKLRIL